MNIYYKADELNKLSLKQLVRLCAYYGIALQSEEQTKEICVAKILALPPEPSDYYIPEAPITQSQVDLGKSIRILRIEQSNKRSK